LFAFIEKQDTRFEVLKAMKIKVVTLCSVHTSVSEGLAAARISETYTKITHKNVGI
jgi:hypothetical protein